MNQKLKNKILDYLLKDLNDVEIIYYRDSIWFIDRERRYWYFEYHKEDKHLWWRWSYFQSALKIFSLNGEEHQGIFGELVNMILNKKQNLETKYPDKVFKTVGSILNFKEDVKEVLNNQVKTTNFFDFTKIYEVEEVLNNEVNTTRYKFGYIGLQVEEVLNNEVKKTLSGGAKKSMEAHKVLDQEVKTASAQKLIKEGMVGEVLNHEVETTRGYLQSQESEVEEVLNCEVETTQSWSSHQLPQVEEILNHNVETIGEAYINDNYVTEEILNNTIDTYDSGELVDEEKLINNVLNYGVNTSEHSDAGCDFLVNDILSGTPSSIEIKSIRKLKGESPLQDIVVSHILAESEKVTDKLKIKEDDRVKSYSCDIFMCDFLVQNVLEIGSNSINFDVTSQQGRVDGVLKNS